MKLRSLVSQITRHGAVYGAGEVAGRVAGFLLIPIYTAVLVPADFGRLQILLSLHQLGQMTADLGLTAAFLRWFGLAETEEERRATATNVASATVLTTVPFVLLFVILAPAIAGVLMKSAEYAFLIRLVAVSVGLRVLATLALTYLRLRERPALYSVFSLGRTLLSLSLVLYFVLVRHLGVYGIILGETIANSAALVCALLVLFPVLQWKIRRGFFREYFRYSIPFVIANLGAFALLATDKFLLSAFGLADETGLYSLGGKLGIALNVLIIWPFTLVWNPTLFRIARDETVEEARRLLSRVFTYMLGLLVWAALAVAILATEVIDVISPPAYASAVKVTPFLILAYVIFGAYRHFQSGLYISGTTRPVATAFVTAGALNIILNLLLIPRLGMIGAALATLASYAVMAGLVLASAQKHYPIPYEWGRVGRLFLWALILYGLTSWIFPTTGLTWPTTLFKGLALAAYPAGVLAMRILTPGERRELSQILRRGRGASQTPPTTEGEV